MMWLGVDPGFTGAIAAISHEGVEHVIDMPLVKTRHGAGSRNELCAHTLRDELLALQHQHGKIRLALVEQVSVRPGQGVTSSGRFMEGYGLVCGVMAALCIPTEKVRPATWKKYMGLGSDKEQSLALARAKWPAAECFTLKKHHGRAEAALLGEYGRRMGL